MEFARNLQDWLLGSTARTFVLEQLEERIVLDGAVTDVQDVQDHAADGGQVDSLGWVSAGNGWWQEDNGSGWWFNENTGWWWNQNTGWYWNESDGWWFKSENGFDFWYHGEHQYWAYETSTGAWFWWDDIDEQYWEPAFTWFADQIGSAWTWVYNDWNGSFYHTDAYQHYQDHFTGSWYFNDAQYGWHLLSDYNPDLYDGNGYDGEPLKLENSGIPLWDIHNVYTEYHVTGKWTGTTYFSVFSQGNSYQNSILDVVFVQNIMFPDTIQMINNHVLKDNALLVLFNTTDFDLRKWVDQVQMISWACGISDQDTPVDDVGILGHGNVDKFKIGTDIISSQPNSIYIPEWWELWKDTCSIWNCNGPYVETALRDLSQVLIPGMSQIQIWECSVAGDPFNSGARSMLDHIAFLTGTTVFASSDYQVGSGAFSDGDWTLEYGTAGPGQKVDYKTIHDTIMNPNFGDPNHIDWGPLNSGYNYGEGTNAPQVSGMTQNVDWTPGSGDLHLGAISVTDQDEVNYPGSEHIHAVLTLANPSAGELSANGAGSFDAATGVWSCWGTVSQVNDALANLTFTPGENFAGTTITTHIEDAAFKGPNDGSILISSGNEFVNIWGRMYFVNPDGSTGIPVEFHPNAERLTDLEPDGGPGGGAMFLTYVNGLVFFAAYDPQESSTELWCTDGTVSGTFLVEDIFPGGNENPWGLTNINNILYFTAYDSLYNYEIWRSDGTPDGTYKVTDGSVTEGDLYFYPDTGSDYKHLYVFTPDGDLFFNGNDGTGTELWLYAASS